MKLNDITNEIGFDSAQSFIDSLVHPKQIGFTITSSGILGSVGYYFEQYVGMAPAVGMAVLLLFGVEMVTGILASKKEGKGFSSKKFGSGLIKMGIYFLIIAGVHVLAQNITPKPLLGFEFNIYEWLHYFFLNFIILQLIISNLENFKRLGWGDFIPAINKITKFLGIKDKK